MVFKDEWALDSLDFANAVRHAHATHVVPVAVAGLDEGMATVRTLVALFLSVRFLMVNHIAEFGCLDMALEALEELVGSASHLVHHVMFFKAHVARIRPISIPHSLLDHLFQDRHALLFSRLRHSLALAGRKLIDVLV